MRDAYGAPATAQISTATATATAALAGFPPCRVIRRGGWADWRLSTSSVGSFKTLVFVGVIIDVAAQTAYYLPTTAV